MKCSESSSPLESLEFFEAYRSAYCTSFSSATIESQEAFAEAMLDTVKDYEASRYFAWMVNSIETDNTTTPVANPAAPLHSHSNAHYSKPREA